MNLTGVRYCNISEILKFKLDNTYIFEFNDKFMASVTVETDERGNELNSYGIRISKYLKNLNKWKIIKEINGLSNKSMITYLNDLISKSKKEAS